jgi:hypothetical protein
MFLKHFEVEEVDSFVAVKQEVEARVGPNELKPLGAAAFLVEESYAGLKVLQHDIVLIAGCRFRVFD